MTKRWGMEAILVMLFTICVCIGMYISINRFVANLYTWRTKELSGSIKKSILICWISFLLISCLWLIIYILSSIFINKFILIAGVGLVATIVELLATKRSGDIQTIKIYNKITCWINLIIATCLLIYYLIMIF